MVRQPMTGVLGELGAPAPDTRRRGPRTRKKVLRLRSWNTAAGVWRGNGQDMPAGCQSIALASEPIRYRQYQIPVSCLVSDTGACCLQMLHHTFQAHFTTFRLWQLPIPPAPAACTPVFFRFRIESRRGNAGDADF